MNPSDQKNAEMLLAFSAKNSPQKRKRDSSSTSSLSSAAVLVAATNNIQNKPTPNPIHLRTAATSTTPLPSSNTKLPPPPSIVVPPIVSARLPSTTVVVSSKYNSIKKTNMLSDGALQRALLKSSSSPRPKGMQVTKKNTTAVQNVTSTSSTNININKNINTNTTNNLTTTNVVANVKMKMNAPTAPSMQPSNPSSPPLNSLSSTDVLLAASSMQKGKTSEKKNPLSVSKRQKKKRKINKPNMAVPVATEVAGNNLIIDGEVVDRNYVQFKIDACHSFIAIIIEKYKSGKILDLGNYLNSAHQELMQLGRLINMERLRGARREDLDTDYMLMREKEKKEAALIKKEKQKTVKRKGGNNDGGGSTCGSSSSSSSSSSSTKSGSTHGSSTSSSSSSGGGGQTGGSR